MRETDTHIYFWGTYLSNFWLAPTKIIKSTEYGDIDFTFKSSEHAFMAFKAIEFQDFDSYQKICEAEDAAAAKALGRKVKNFDPIKWDKVSYDLMLTVCMAKFSQNPLVKYNLLDTKDKIIVEASPYDKIWGVGLHFDDDRILDEKNWLGENRLGKVLMEVRSNL